VVVKVLGMTTGVAAGDPCRSSGGDRNIEIAQKDVLALAVGAGQELEWPVDVFVV